ncbi:hypothetical protein [Microcystis phage LMM01]|uniref:Uncharacterized protein n=1 Tax=Microcystis phage LMM01 TaxID=2856824 RepID=A0A7G4_9CAUD|nr:hypothetical protein MaLMM01_gp050 [Microcystis phage LMM01]BAF36141.1 hypothetical protein [Microcystis phage LMM01]
MYSMCYNSIIVHVLDYAGQPPRDRLPAFTYTWPPRPPMEGGLGTGISKCPFQSLIGFKINWNRPGGPRDK